MFTLKMPYTSWSHLLLCARKFRKNNDMSYGEIFVLPTWSLAFKERKIFYMPAITMVQKKTSY